MRASLDPNRSIERLARGEIADDPDVAFRLMDQAWPVLTRFVQQRLLHRKIPREWVKDCGQNVFRRVWKYRKSYRGTTESEWWAWVRMITDNELRRLMAAESRHPIPQSDLESRTGSPEEPDFREERPDARPGDPTVDSVFDRETRTEVRACLGKLAPTHRKVVDLIYLRGELSERAVAEVLGCSPSYVHKLKAQAIERLRRCMERKGIDARSPIR